MSDDFDLDVHAAAALADEVGRAVAERDEALRKPGGVVSAAAGDRSADLRTRLTRLDRAIEGLETSLREQGEDGVDARLIARRAETVRKIKLQRDRLRERERTTPAGSDREALLSSGAGKSYGRETELTRDATVQEMVARSHDEMKTQDAVLDQMSKSLDSIKVMGKVIGDETALHMVRWRPGHRKLQRFSCCVGARCSWSIVCAVILAQLFLPTACLCIIAAFVFAPLQTLLDNLEGEIDRGDAKLQRETARVDHAMKESRTCWLYTAICLLLVVLLALVLVRWA